jgi:hypothetical protein
MPEHYGTLAAAGVYIATLANGAKWGAANEGDRTNALIRASRSLDGIHGANFPGTKAGGRAQEREWPRTSAEDLCTGETIPADIVPVEVENAAYALALVELVTPGATSPSFTPGNVMKREKMDVMERERFGPNDGVSFSLADMRPQFAAVEDTLRCILVKARGGGSVCALRY